jgi:hypothetical protein
MLDHFIDDYLGILILVNAHFYVFVVCAGAARCSLERLRSSFGLGARAAIWRLRWRNFQHGRCAVCSAKIYRHC